MKKTVLTYGLIGGVIVSAMMWMTMSGGHCDFDNGLWIGYTTMVVALSTIFFAVKTYRDKHLGGTITGGRAFLMGLSITLIASTMYVASWMVLSSVSAQDYMEEYYEHEKAKLESSPLSAEQVAAELETMRSFQEMYKNPVVKVGFTYTEILPVGLLISLIVASLLARPAMFRALFSFDGRITRTEYGFSVMFNSIILFAGFAALAQFPGVLLLILLPLTWMFAAQGAKRCHDLGRSGWFQLIPFYSLYMLFARGDAVENRFGDDPRGSVGGGVKFEASKG